MSDGDIHRPIDPRVIDECAAAAWAKLTDKHGDVDYGIIQAVQAIIALKNWKGAG